MSLDDHPEIVAMRACANALRGLTSLQRTRVLNWVCSVSDDPKVDWGEVQGLPHDRIGSEYVKPENAQTCKCGAVRYFPQEVAPEDKKVDTCVSCQPTPFVRSGHG